MKKIRLPIPKEKKFIELYHSGYGWLVDCYIEAYSSKGSRRTSMANASRVRDRPPVYLYLGWLRELQVGRELFNEQDIGYEVFLNTHGFVLRV